MQEDVGLHAATDGEFRRASWHMDFIYQLGGVTRVPEEKLTVHFHSDEGELDAVFSGMHVDGKLGPRRDDLRRRLRVPARHRDDAPSRS